MEKLYEIAAKTSTDVYKNHISIGPTQYQQTLTEWRNRPLQVIAVAGTNQAVDHKSNLNLWSKNGVKIGGYEEARTISRNWDIDPAIPILFTGHSRGGPTVIELQRSFDPFNINWCIPFNPARSLRYWANRKMERTIIFRDPDDIVSELLGIVSFCHPKCLTYFSPDDKPMGIKDHDMALWIDFIDGLTL